MITLSERLRRAFGRNHIDVDQQKAPNPVCFDGRCAKGGCVVLAQMADGAKDTKNPIRLNEIVNGLATQAADAGCTVITKT